MRRLTTVGIVGAIIVALAGAAVFGRAYTLRDSVLPGVQVAGVDVGGLSRADARAKIEAAIGDRLARPITVGVGEKSFTATPDDLFALDAAATEQLAYATARRSFGVRLAAIAAPFAFATDVAPVLELKEEGRATFLRRLLALTDRPAPARLSMKGRAPAVVPARAGTEVDESALVEAIRTAALADIGVVDARVAPLQPELTTEEAETAAATARAALAAPLRLTFAGKRIGVLYPKAIAKMLRFQPIDGTYEVTLDSLGLEASVGPLVRPLTRKPVDATFRVAGKRVRVVPSRAGTTLATDETREAILAAATAPGARKAAIGLAKLPADFTTREAKELGIREQVSTYTTDMGESSSNRVWNVQLLGRFLDGTILRPGQWFRYNEVMGPRTAERGFREGQMIFGGVLIPSIGGGVCQTGTTIFNTAFEAGLPIRERHNHSFYISHYPLGRDATVSWGGPDLVFRNDLDHAILIKAHGTSETFTVTFYGTKQGRRVVSSTSEPTNYTAPRLQYAIDPSAPPGSVRTASGGGSGFDVNVHRKVFEGGKLVREDDFFTRYTPQNPTAIYGPGSTPPGPYFYLPSSA
jgi:vancomycin resistance protein YoaR